MVDIQKIINYSSKCIYFKSAIIILFLLNSPILFSGATIRTQPKEEHVHPILTGESKVDLQTQKRVEQLSHSINRVSQKLSPPSVPCRNESLMNQNDSTPPITPRREKKVPSLDQINECKEERNKHKYFIQTKLTEGSFGVISEVCTTDQPQPLCDWIEKTVILGDEHRIFKENDFNFQNELENQTLLGASLTPEIKNSYYCKENGQILGKIVMKKMDGDLEKYLQRDQDINQNSLKNDLISIFYLIEKMHSLKIIHRDLHLKNIFYKIENYKTRFYLGDFGLSYQYKNNVNHEISPSIQNFTGLRLGRQFYEEKYNDYKYLLTDLKYKFGINICLHKSQPSTRTSTSGQCNELDSLTGNLTPLSKVKLLEFYHQLSKAKPSGDEEDEFEYHLPGNRFPSFITKEDFKSNKFIKIRKNTILIDENLKKRLEKLDKIDLDIYLDQTHE